MAGSPFLSHLMTGIPMLLWALFQTYSNCGRYWRAVLTQRHFLGGRRKKKSAQHETPGGGGGGDGVSDTDEHQAVRLRLKSVDYYNKVYYYRNTNSEYFYFGLRNIPVNSLIIFLLPPLGMIHTMISYEWTTLDAEQLQHFIMLGMLSFYGFVDLLARLPRAPIPLGSDYFALFLASAAEALVLSMHFHGKSLLESSMHKLIMYTAVAAAVATVFEVCCRRSVVAALARTFFMILQGLQWCLAAFVLLSPWESLRAVNWYENEHENVLAAVALFVLAAAIDFTMVLMLSVLAYCSVSKELHLTSRG